MVGSAVDTINSVGERLRDEVGAGEGCAVGLAVGALVGEPGTIGSDVGVAEG
eukprot:CAMPEP_0197061352 /NCGR_PEP_ID=MMETSP1384-20130603/135815_1 /TAXON_ID=29189 /ORGANISM="Ammonia sp." /LENGTH=51 /DNA_ID=CAMNT_0042496967 /DNA_START=63 /DNA_END=215 /DNA_ORIENTATION=-